MDYLQQKTVNVILFLRSLDISEVLLGSDAAEESVRVSNRGLYSTELILFEIKVSDALTDGFNNICRLIVGYVLQIL